MVLTLNYSNCPMLCSLQLDGLFDGLKKMKWDLGDQYRMVTVSIDPKESTERAAMTRDKYLRHYGRAGAGAGYAMLTGKNDQIKKLADTVGFHYRYVPETGEYCARGRDDDLHARRAVVAVPGRRGVRPADAADVAAGGLRGQDRQPDGSFVPVLFPIRLRRPASTVPPRSS